jgi:hypothetical protein
MVIVYCDKGEGWAPISYMVELAVRLFDAELIVLKYKTPGTLQKLSALLLSRRPIVNREKLLFICPSPKELPIIFQISNIRKRFNFIAAWVIDSFWVDRIPRTIQLSRYFDHFFITSKEDILQWEKMTKTSVSWLPWGTDALVLGGKNGNRKLDLLRVGRQPVEWDDDRLTEKSCTGKNIKFQGRPEFLDEHVENQKALMAIYQQSKFVLAYSNTANPAGYTHPIRSYLTGRWTDTLACGGIVAGISPKDPSNEELLWDGATLELGSIKREEGLVILKEALSNWNPQQAEHNYKKSLQGLDWRWRFMEIAKFFQIQPKKLIDEIKLLELRIGQ